MLFIVREIFSEKISKQTLQLILFSVLNHCLGKCANSKNITTINAVRRPRFSCPEIYNKCSCTASSKFVQTTINTAVQNLYFCAKNAAELCCTEQPSAASIFVPNLVVQPVVRPYCMTSFFRKPCPKILPFTVLTQLYGLAEMLPWKVCQAAASFSSLPRNLPCSLALLLSICS